MDLWTGWAACAPDATRQGDLELSVSGPCCSSLPLVRCHCCRDFLANGTMTFPVLWAWWSHQRPHRFHDRKWEAVPSVPCRLTSPVPWILPGLLLQLDLLFAPPAQHKTKQELLPLPARLVEQYQRLFESVEARCQTAPEEMNLLALKDLSLGFCWPGPMWWMIPEKSKNNFWVN